MYGKGKIQIKNGIRVIIGWDFVAYYQKLIDYYYYRTLRNQLPAHGGHISIVLPNFHKDIDYGLVKQYDGVWADFEYDPTNVIITSKNIWIPVDLPVGWEIKNKLGIKNEKGFKGYHATVVNFKFK